MGRKNIVLAVCWRGLPFPLAQESGGRRSLLRRPRFSLPGQGTVLRTALLDQRFGRLIRKETDRGAFGILDHCIVQSPYARVSFQSLPRCRRTEWLEDLMAFMREC